MVWMTAFHFCFDLSHFGYWPQDFRADPLWTVQRTLIVSLFLGCAGLGQAVAWQRQVGWARFARRWSQITACALLVTVGSFLMFPRSFIYFGVLHGMAVMLVITRLTAGWGRWLWLAGLLHWCRLGSQAGRCRGLFQNGRRYSMDGASTGWAGFRESPLPRTMCRSFRGWASCGGGWRRGSGSLCARTAGCPPVAACGSAPGWFGTL